MAAVESLPFVAQCPRCGFTEPAASEGDAVAVLLAHSCTPAPVPRPVTLPAPEPAEQPAAVDLPLATLVGPCVECGRPMQSKALGSTRPREGVAFHDAKGRCHSCATRARRHAHAETTRPQPASMVGLPPADVLEQALCAQTDPEAFFPEKGGSARGPKAICQRCPVQAECLNWALASDQQHGVWGGLSAQERHKLRRRAGAA